MNRKRNSKTRKAYPKKYIPSYLDKKDAAIIKKELDKSNKMYKKNKYYVRTIKNYYLFGMII